MVFIDPTTTDDVFDRWPYFFQHTDSSQPIYDYIGAYRTELTAVDNSINSLYNEKFVESATGRELEKLAAEVGITRQPGENDSELRLRARLRKSVAASNGTPSDIENVVSIAFEDEDLGAIDVTHSSGHPVTQFSVPQSYLDAMPLTRADFQEELTNAFPAGYGVEVVSSDTWVLGESGSQGLGQGGLI